MIKHLVIVGPTASGKSSLAMQVANRLDAEIIAADSRTVYKQMNIGTAKPTLEDQKKVVHHCIDLVYPNQAFTVADFVQHAKQARHVINQKGSIDIMVGGSGLFIDSFIYAFTFAPPNIRVRREYENASVQELKEHIAQKQIPMPENSHNKRYLIRALERDGHPAPRRSPLGKDTLLIGLNPDKERLMGQIQHRTWQMLKDGLEDEARQLFSTYGTHCQAFNGGAYKIMQQHLFGNLTKEQIEDAIRLSDWHLAKKQMTWFKRNTDIQWFATPEEAHKYVVDILK